MKSHNYKIKGKRGVAWRGGKTVTKAPHKSSLEKDTETQQVCSQKSPEFMKCTAGTVWSPSTAPLITTLEGNVKKIPVSGEKHMSERGGKEEEGESVTQSRRAGAHREKVEAEMANRVQRRHWSP